VKHIKLVYITRGFPPYPGGSENYTWEIYKRISKINDIELITYYNREREKSKSIHEIRRLKNGNKFLEFLNFLFGTLRQSLFLEFDAIHAVTYPSGLAAILPKLVSGKPLVVTIHDIGVIEKDVTSVSPLVKSLKGFLQGVVCNFADLIIVPSEKVRNDIMKYHDISKSKIFITPYGVDTNTFNTCVKRGVMKNKWGLKEEPVVLYVGMYSPKKGLEYLIEAISNVRKQIPDIMLVIAGPALDANYEKKIKNLVAEKGLEKSVIFTGYFDEKYKPNVYMDADIVIEPTHYGMGYSFACIEASALGKPVIATKLLEEIGVVKNNVSGVVVPLRDSKSIAEAIIKLLKNKKLYARLSKLGTNFVKSFNWDETARLTEEVYKKLYKYYTR
jgi:glycosyltransferase involved in cell wall biosynthesis